MSVKTHLTFIYTALTASLLLLYAAFVYFSAAGDRKAEFYNLLKKEAITKANVLLDARVDAETLQTIYRQNREIFSEVEVAIYDPDFNLLYHDAIDIDFVKEPPDMICDIVEKVEIRFTQEDWQVIGLLFWFEGSQFVITAITTMVDITGLLIYFGMATMMFF
jgi:two-component system, OmpR family, sensor histidine kinase ArlS